MLLGIILGTSIKFSYLFALDAGLNFLTQKCYLSSSGNQFVPSVYTVFVYQFPTTILYMAPFKFIVKYGVLKTLDVHLTLH